MAARGCRIAVSCVSVFALLGAIALTIAAVATPQWQVAELEQIHQMIYVGLFQTCAYGYRQGLTANWVCTFIPYNQQYLQGQWNTFGGLGGLGGLASEGYGAYGADSWRLSTLVLLSMAVFFGFLSLASETIELCLDATRTLTCLKAMSGLSLLALVLATLCCLIGVLIFAINSQQNQNMYIMELTTFAIMRLGQSFYLGIVALVTFIVALGLDIGATVLTCITAKPRRQPQGNQLYYIGKDTKQQTKQSRRPSYGSETISIPDPPQMPHVQRAVHPMRNDDEESTAWKYPKVARV